MRIKQKELFFKKIQAKCIYFMNQFFNQINTLWQKSAEAELHVEAPTQTSNPYIAARQEWNLMFGDLIKAKYNWQRIAFIALAINSVLLIGFVLLSLQTRYIPYAVKVDALGNSVFAGYLDKSNINETIRNPLEVNAFVRRYIINARSVISDPIAEKQALEFVYATSSEKTAKVLNDFYRQNSPFKTATQATIEVQVNAVLQKSDKTWQVNWTEIQRNLEGGIVEKNHWEGLVTVAHYPITDSKQINVNPLGLFVEYISWSQQN